VGQMAASKHNLFKNNNSHAISQNNVAIGDNLEYLNYLERKSEKFDVIYIDPPYNTGNKFSYNDKRATNEWIDFIEKRLSLAHRILKLEGVIFISIDDNFLYELKILCDKIFGKSNFLGNFVTKQAVRSNSKFINTIHEYVLSYAKDRMKMQEFKILRLNNPTDSEMIREISEKVKNDFVFFGREHALKYLSELNNKYMKEREITWLRNYSEIDEKGEIFFPKDLSVPGSPAELDIEEIGLKLPALQTRRWSSKQKFIQLHNEEKLHFKGYRPYEKHYLKDSYDNVLSILDFYSRQGTNDLVKLGLRNLFDTPKPVELIKYLIRIATAEKGNANILDFFAGSGTTGQAVMEVNMEDNKKHSFHLVQIDDEITKESMAYQFCLENNLHPTFDQLLIYRLNKFIKKQKTKFEYNILKTREL
jgi:adenine-specific DNA-methyltransferase